MIKAEWTNADALTLQPTCNQLATDCISRQAAIDLMLAALDDDWEPDYAKDRMCELPSAQPERKRGKWLRKDDCTHSPFDTTDRYVCTCCGLGFNWGEASSARFCPNCGAEMKGEQE